MFDDDSFDTETLLDDFPEIHFEDDDLYDPFDPALFLIAAYPGFWSADLLGGDNIFGGSDETV